MAVLACKPFRAEAEQAQMDLERITGEEMQRQIADIDDTPKKLVNKVAAAVAPSREKQ